MKNNKIVTTFIVLVISLFSSCSEWLNVESKTLVDEEVLFSKEQGFKEALIGVYMSLSDPSIYGREMTYGIIEALAQRYKTSQQYSGVYGYTNAAYYDFANSANDSATDPIWESSYNLIANLNNLLDWEEKQGEVIYTNGLRDIIKGEALALRAFLYFDLLRMWGPIMSVNPNAESIVYRTTVGVDGLPLVDASVVADSIISDLKKAEILLKDDPMTFGLDADGSYNEEVPFLSRRFKRMNRDAIKALLARVYLYVGDKENALAYALEVINSKTDEGENRYTFVTDNSKDRIFSTEIIFSISVDEDEFGDQYDDDVKSGGYYLIYQKDYLDEIYNVAVDGVNDIRYRTGRGFELITDNYLSLKLDQGSTFMYDVLENTIPLIRLPEMYYIAAECTEDLVESTIYLNTVRLARGVLETPTFENEEERMYALELEYRKEFYSEGQLWFFYKRTYAKTFCGYSLDVDMTEANYRFSYPDDEETLGDII